jgi:hypothetical protein
VRELRIEIDPTLVNEDSDKIFASDFFKRAQEAAARHRATQSWRATPEGS